MLETSKYLILVHTSPKQQYLANDKVLTRPCPFFRTASSDLEVICSCSAAEVKRRSIQKSDPEGMRLYQLRQTSDAAHFERTSSSAKICSRMDSWRLPRQAASVCCGSTGDNTCEGNNSQNMFPLVNTLGQTHAWHFNIVVCLLNVEDKVRSRSCSTLGKALPA